MLMPTLTTSEDMLAIIEYLKTKPSGVSYESAKAAIDQSLLDYRKISAYKYWMIIKDDVGNLFELTEYGREIGRKLEDFQKILRKIVKKISPYFSVLEWAHYHKLNELSNVDAIVYWKEHSSDSVSQDDGTASRQAACFFRFCEGAGLGEMKIGRKGNPTRFTFNTELLYELINQDPGTSEKPITETKKDTLINSNLKGKQKNGDRTTQADVLAGTEQFVKQPIASSHSDELYKRVYITHGKNVKFLETLKRMLEFGELEPVVSIDTQSVSKPVPEKIMDEMRSCGAAIIHVDKENKLIDETGKEITILNENVLIEIGAALALYGKRIILLVREGVKLPSNLQGLYEVRYSEDQLDGDKTIKLLEAIKQLKHEKIPD